MKYRHLFFFSFLWASLASLAANGDIFTSPTEEGIEITFKVLSEEDHTCQVGADTTEPAISNEYEGRLTIPSSAGGYTVVSISNFAFLDCIGISEMVLPETITMFANYAFLGVGTESSPCLITVSEDFDFGVDTSGAFFRWKGGIFRVIQKPYACLSAEGTTLTFFCDGKESSHEGSIFRLNEGNDIPEWHSTLSAITEVVFDPSFAEAFPSTTNSWFEDMSQLSIIVGLEYLNTSRVTQMNSMFKGCCNLTDLNLGNFDFSNVTDMTRMFSNCTGLHTLDLSSMFINEGTTTNEMLGGCYSLDTLSISSSMSGISPDACIGVGSTESPCILYAPEGLEVAYLDGEMFLWKSGLFRYLQTKAYVIEGDDKLTFCFDNLYYDLLSDSTFTIHMLDEDNSSRTWSFTRDESTTTKKYKVIFTPSFSQFHPCNTSSWFALDVDDETHESNIELEFEGMENLNTCEVTNMSRMFYGCMNATGMDFSQFDTSKVTDMSYMFAYCTTETKMVLNNFDTSNVTDLSGMFYCCTGLKSLDLSNFDTSNVESLSGMFYGCSNLLGVDLSGFNTSKVNCMSNLFTHCHSLRSLDISHFNTSEVTTMNNMFAYCEQIAEINLSEFDTQNVVNMDAMFFNCKNLIEINLNNFNTSNVTTMRGMFAKCKSITSLDLSMLNFSEVMYYDSPEIEKNGIWEDTEDDGELGFLSECNELNSIYIPITLDGLSDISCVGIGTEDMPCLIYAPEDFDFDTDTYCHSFIWKGGYFTLDHNIDPKSVAITVDTDLLLSGDQSDMKINLFNGDEIFNGFQFEIHLPDDVRLAKKGNDFAYQLSDRFSSKGMNITIKDYGNGNYRLIAFSLSNIIIEGSEGCIITLKLKAEPGLLSGEYQGNLCNIIFSNIDGYSTELDNVEFSIPISSYALGDVNHDGYINVTDIMIVVNCILDNHPLNFHEENADMNHDNRIDVTDVMQIVNLILINDGTYSAPQDHSTSGESISLAAMHDGYDISFDSSERYTACQMKLHLSEGATLSNATINDPSGNHRVHTHDLGNGNYNIVVYSPENKHIDTFISPLHLHVNGAANSNITLSDIILTNDQLETLVMPDIKGVTTGIAETTTNIDEIPSYTLQGTKAPANAKGILIRKGRKIVAK